MKYPKMDWGTMEAVVNKLGGEDGVRRFLSDDLTVNSAPKKGLLAFITSINLPAIPRFKASTFFEEDTSDEALVKISWIGQNFRTDFLKKIENEVPATELKVRKITTASLDPEIMTEIGESKRIISLAYLAKLLEDQGHGKQGVLLVNGYANIFYIEDANRILWAVNADWDGLGWNVEANSVESPGRWSAGCRVFSR